MNYKDYPGAAQHGDAWKYFRDEVDMEALGESILQSQWHWFLRGWKQKGKQRVDVRCKTR